MLLQLRCVRCDGGFEHDAPGGHWPERCPPCRILRKKEVDSAKAKRYREANPERAREQWQRSSRKRLADPEHLRWKREDAMRRAYGLSPEDFETLLAGQGGVCAVCQGPPNGPGKRLHVDHDHESGKVRGLLCAKCNTASGLLDDDPERVEFLVTYLRKHLIPSNGGTR